MKLRAAPRWIAAASMLVALGFGAAVALTRGGRLDAAPTGTCASEYADSMQMLSLRARQIEQGPRGQYTYLVRSSASYECPFFGTSGKLQRRRVNVSELGTAFAYESSGNDTFLLSNEHVAAWPEVTAPGHTVEGVPEGCKRVNEKLRIVRDERDDYEPGQIALTRVATDPLLDAAVLKAGQKLNLMPYRPGRSSALRAGNVVQVRGFPLGVMQAVSDGKVVNPYDRDLEQGWDHVDFVIDALLSEGNSGSPVLALSCSSHEFELVGIYHAGYRGHSALNVVVGIDQLVDFMHRKKRVPRALTADDPSGAPGLADRKRLQERLTSALPLFEFGGLTMRVEAQGTTLLYHFYGHEFPLDDRRTAVLEDLPSATGFGETGRLWVDGGQGWREWPLRSLGTEERDLVARLTDSVRLQVLRSLDYRRALANPSSADDRRRIRELSRTFSRNEPLAKELANGLVDMVERLAMGPEGTQVAVTPVSAAPETLPAVGPPGK